MSVADIDRQRLVNAYLDGLIRVVEPAELRLARTDLNKGALTQRQAG